MAQKNKRTNFDSVLKMVREEPKNVFNRYARMLSDLSAEKTARLREVLAEMPTERRIAFFRAMEDTALDYLEHDFGPVAEIGLEDEDGEIRRLSILTLSFDDSREIGAKILAAAENDPDVNAQIAAINLLGQYMFEESLEEPIPVSGKKLHAVLESLLEHKNAAVRRAAVAAYAVSETKRVNEIIGGYLAGNDREELITGLVAVRLSLNKDRSESVLELMSHEDEGVAAEAIRAAGSLQLREALPNLYEILTGFDRISPELLVAAANAVAEIGDEGSLDVLETLGEAVVDMDEEITEAVDDCIDSLNMGIYMDPFDEDEEGEGKLSRQAEAMLQNAIDLSKDRCLAILEEKIPHDLEDDEAFDFSDDEDDEDGCECGEHHHHHHHHHDNPLDGLDLSRFRILDDLEAYETSAHHDADEEDLWAEFEDMAEEDLDADSLQDFINKLEKRKKK